MFEISSSKKRFDANKITILENGYPYIVRQSSNNGIKGYLNEALEFLNEGNTISFGQDTATMFYQREPYFTGDKIKILKLKNRSLNKILGLFFVSIMTKSFSLFSWGSSSFSIKIIKNQQIKLPTKNNKIDFKFMEEFIKELENAKLKKLKEYLKENNLDNSTLTQKEKEALEKFEKNEIEWEKFEFDMFFKLCKIKNKLTKSNLSINGKIAVFSAESENNGIIGYTNLEPDFVLNSENLFYIIFGDHTISFNIAKNNFCVADNVKVLSINKGLSLRIVKFIITSWKKKIPNKGYSRHWSIAKNTKISLPTKDNQIDFDFMENLISGLEKLIVRKIIPLIKETNES